MESAATTSSPGAIGSVEAAELDVQRFGADLEYLQLFASKAFVTDLLHNGGGLLGDKAYRNYLEYLRYFERPAYLHFIEYPLALQVIEAVRNDDLEEIHKIFR